MANTITLVFYVKDANEDYDLDDMAEMLADDAKRRYPTQLLAVEHIDRDAPRTYGYLVGSEEAVEAYDERNKMEPNPMQDDCVFCQRLTDEERSRRTALKQQPASTRCKGRNT